VKKVGVVLCVLLWTVGIVAGAVSICDYKSPETSLTDARLSLSYRYYDDAATEGIEANSGRFAADYDQLYGSPNYAYSITGSAELSLNDFMPAGWLGQAGATFRYYPMEDSLLFAFGDMQATVATGQLRPGVEVRFGGGWGRFYDVTPMAKAMRMQRELFDLGVLSNDLSDDVLMAIAGIIGRAIEYETVKDLVADIETLVEADTAVELDAQATLTLEEIVQQAGDDRQCGWAVQAGIGYELIDPFGNPQNIIVAGSADAAFAFGPDDQIKVYADASGPFDILNEHTLSAGASYEVAISGDTTFIADYALQQVKPLGADPNLSHAADFSLSFDLGGADILLQVALTRDAAAPGWSLDISVSAAMDLL